MKRDPNRWLAIRIVFALVLAFLPLACGGPPPSAVDTPRPPITSEEPTPLPATATPVPEPPPTVPPTAPAETPSGAPEPSPSDLPPDVVFHNGSILTMEAEQPEAQALAIQGESILAVGSNEDILALAGPQTQVIDLQGRSLMPGFVDAHTHILSAPDQYGTDLEGIQDLALGYGITTLADAGTAPDLLDRLRTLEQEGRLRVRTSVYLSYTSNCGDLKGDWYRDYAPTREPGEMLRIGGVKIFSDGGSCGGPAVSFEYPNGVGQGDLFFTQEEMDRIVAGVHAEGYQMAIHALGDRAIEQVQNAIAAALDGEPNTLRHRIEHNGLLRPELMPRYSEIGIVPLIFGEYPICIGSGTTGRYRYAVPEEYRPWEWRWRDLLDANPGLPIAWHGDDPPIPPVNPIIDLYGFVTRRHIKEDGSICEPPDWFAANAITVEEALRIMTMGSAYALFRDEEVGSLKPGKLADLIIISENPVTVDPNTIKDIEVLMTMVGGRVEYCASGYETLCPVVEE
ncbi:MAG: amidohydrolase family protein [Anaerolineae bacterium]|nr:amidohydrolase family protein [Anaerolineae bacterium]